MNKKKIVCIIPARLASTRFPEKILATLAGQPLLKWVWDAAIKCKQFSEVVFAIDSQKAEQVIKSFGGKYLMTSPTCKCGTDRLVEIMNSGRVEADVWVNWQGDEPFIGPKIIHDLLQSCHIDDSDMWTLKKRILNECEITNPNFAKVVCTHDGHALYFSRSMIPFYRDKKEGEKIFFKHVGIYAYSAQALRKIAVMPPSYLEDAECLEQLRFLQNGLRIKLHETDLETIGIDLPQDIARAEEFLRNR